ncbi:MAG: hypothetical protein NVSMB2_26570 [Chloroflexota bacterium]
MGFSRSDIVPSMDVYTLDNVYLGAVLSVAAGASEKTRERVADDALQSGTTSGELLGPMPTQTLGNPGPRNQSARTFYGTQPASARLLGQGTMEVGRWWGIMGRRTIPVDAVQTVSLERVILRLRQQDLPT